MAAKGGSEAGSKSLDNCIIHSQRVAAAKLDRALGFKGFSIPFLFLVLKWGRLLSQLVRVSCIKVFEKSSLAPISFYWRSFESWSE